MLLNRRQLENRGLLILMMGLLLLSKLALVLTMAFMYLTYSVDSY